MKKKLKYMKKYIQILTKFGIIIVQMKDMILYHLITISLVINIVIMRMDLNIVILVWMRDIMIVYVV